MLTVKTVVRSSLIDGLGLFAEVPCDATIAWPLIVKAVQERLAAAV